MNKIFKVIYSKVRNCYVVTSEFAKANTKSSTGSAKQTAKKSLLSLAIAMGIACGGFVNVGAADTVEVLITGSPTATVATVYTQEGTESYVHDRIKELTEAGDVFTNRDNIAKLQTTTTEQGKQIATNTANIVNNAAAIAKKIDTETADAKLALKADAADVNNKLAQKADVTALDAKADKTYVDQKFTEAGTNVDTKLANYATTAYVDGKIADEGNARNNAITAAITQETNDRNNAIDTAINGEAINRNQAIQDAIGKEETKRDAAIANAKTELQNKITAEETARKAADVELTGKITEEKTARENADTALNNQLTTAEGKIGANKTAINALKAKDTELEGKITTLDGKVTTDINDLKAKDTDLANKIRTNADNIQTNKNAIAATNQRTAGIKRDDVRDETTIEGNVTVDKSGNVTAKGKLRGDGVDAGSLIVENASNLKGDVTMNQKLNVTGDTTLKGTKVDGKLTVTDEADLKNTKVDGTLTTTGKATFQEAVEMDKGLTVTNGATKLKETTVEGTLTAGDADLKNTKVDGTLNVTGATTLDGTLTAKGEATFKEKVTMEKDLEVKGALKTDKISMKNTDTDADGWKHDSATTITADGITHIGEMEKSGVIKKSQFTHTEEGSETYAKKGDTGNWTETRSDVKADGVTTKVEDSKQNRTNTSQTADGIKGYATDKDGNKTYTKVTATENSFQVQDKNGENTNHQVNTKDSSVTEIKNEAGATTKTEQTAENITNTAEKGTIKNNAMNIENNASGKITNKSDTMETTVTGKATESYGELETTIKGNESHSVERNQTTTVKGDVEENYEKNLTTKIGGNELHEVTGSKTETVNGKVTENYKGGQETNVTGDQMTNVSGTQTTNATDINRNASSGMIDTIDNDYGTNKETKVAGKTTTEVSIKGTGEKGEYIRGATESRDYLIKGTLENSETKTAGSTSTRVTDGTNIASTIQDAKNVADSVTNGTDTGVSGIHANADGSVSIDSAVTDSTSTSTINQKKDSITSAVGEGGNSTVIRQDKDNVTIASSNGTVAISGKDIINTASGNMTNTVGGDLTTTVTGKTKEEYKGGLTTTVTGDESHTVTANQTNEVDGNQTNTIKGNQTTTVTGDISNSAKNIANEASEKLTDKVGSNTRVLDHEGITDTVGNTSFKQRINDIMMEAKNGTITSDAKNIRNKATETITNEAVDITNTATGTISSSASEIKNKADKLISNKVGENTYQNIEDGKITESIKNGTKQNLTQSDADGTNHSVVDGAKSSVTKQTSEEITGAVTDGTSTNVTQNTATSSNNTIASNGKANSVISTVNGTEFVNSDAAAPVTGASGIGSADRTTIKGNTITTGKVTMDYAEVMKDLGVHGNANIVGKTTTGELEVTGKSTLKGDVTMESNATVKKDLTVEGNATVKKDLTVDGTTTTKDLSVTNNATVGGTLDVTGKATFGDSVEVAKDLSVGGNATIAGDVTAKSYKVGDKTYIDANGINANNQVISNVADGTIAAGSTDAVNGGQLFETNRRIDQFDSRINEVGANAAAMANLHPMEFDADSKLNVAVGVGNYRNKTATAMGLFYRPNEDVMFNVSSTIGSSDNMIGGGVSFRLGSGGNKLKNKAFADAAEQNKQLKSQVDTLQAQMDALLSVINPNMSKDFPDVPDNHWAYEAVSRLAGNDIIQGYEDGKYHGERTMTRYEMAVIIYKALQKGAKAEAKLVEEFKPELKAIAVHEKA